MTAIAHDLQSRRRAVRLWLLAVAALIVATLVVGGATRLTESGLSIVEWKPVTGVVPPLDAAAWRAEFEKYQTIPQFRERNSAMSLDQFKTIYWWEWTHRLLARLVGAAFLLPFLWFLWRGWIEPHMRMRLWTIFALGAALGAVGWWMVSSGLSGRVSVSQYRLAFHLTLACVIFAAILWTEQSLRPTPRIITPATHSHGRHGHRRPDHRADLSRGAGGGAARRPHLQHLAADRRQHRSGCRATVLRGSSLAQFLREHAHGAVRSPPGGLCAVAVAVLHAVDVARTGRGGAALAGALVLAFVVTLQAALGIVTLLHQAPLALALLHQAMAIAVLTVAVVHAQRLAPASESARAAEHTGFHGREQAT